jgi:hypothetical protein
MGGLANAINFLLPKTACSPKAAFTLEIQKLTAKIYLLNVERNIDSKLKL